MTKRLLWADLIRSLSIYFVVVIHNSIVPEKFSLIGLLPATIFMIVKTSIPMFVMLSGALLLGKKENYVIFFKKRFVKVFFPWLIWTFIYMAWNYNFHHYQPHTPSQWKYFFELTFFSQLWFLPLIAGIYLLTPIFRIIIQSGRLVDRYYYIILWFLLVLFFPYIHPSLAFPFDPSGFFQQAILYSGYFILGYLIIDKTPSRLSRKYLTVLYSLFIICILWTLFDYFFTSKSMQAYNYIAPNIALGSIVLFVILFQLFRNYKTNISSPLILN